MKQKLKDIKILFLFIYSSIMITISWLILEISNNMNIRGVLTFRDIRREYILANILIIISFYLIGYIIFNKIIVTSIINLSIFYVLSVINYYVLNYHGLPFSVQELYNTKTALNVIDSYHIIIDKNMIAVTLLYIIGVIISIIYNKFDRKLNRNPLFNITSVSLIVLFYILLFTNHFGRVQMEFGNTVNKQLEYANNGYMISFFISLKDEITGYMIKPDNYNEVMNMSFCLEEKVNNQDNPDIILILNETLYDPKLLIPELQTDIDYFSNIHAMIENGEIIYSYAVMQGTGGTNRSEYELLTSNSLNIFKTTITPFYNLNLKESTSIVSILNNMGYYTLAFHASNSKNYNRNQSYIDLGFDNIYFEDNFEYNDFYYNREYITDSAAYRTITSEYEDIIANNNQPVFMYLLTMQNHGGYDINQPEYDIVHSLGDYKSEELDEYLTALYLSDKAFKELTEYYNSIDRNVIICMLGDHITSLLSSEINDENYLYACSTPLIIWTNYDVNAEVIEEININIQNGLSEIYVVPYIFQLANINQSYYYSYIYDMSKEYPVATLEYDFYPNSINNVINTYFCLEYNNLSNKSERKNQLFE